MPRSAGPPPTFSASGTSHVRDVPSAPSRRNEPVASRSSHAVRAMGATRAIVRRLRRFTARWYRPRGECSSVFSTTGAEGSSSGHERSDHAIERVQGRVEDEVVVEHSPVESLGALTGSFDHESRGADDELVVVVQRGVGGDRADLRGVGAVGRAAVEVEQQVVCASGAVVLLPKRPARCAAP